MPVPDSLLNPYRGKGLRGQTPLPSSGALPVARSPEPCPARVRPPLRAAPALAAQAGVARLADLPGVRPDSPVPTILGEGPEDA
ncbi:MAG: hypothetical protein ACP5DX_06965 [Paracoccaceae bacterium]